MLKEHRRFFSRLFILSDLILVGGAWVLSYMIRFRSGWLPLYHEVPEINVYLVHLPLVLSVWAASFVHMGVYRSNRWLDLSKELYVVCRGTFFSIALIICTIYLSTKIEISRIFYVCFSILTLLPLVLSRVLLRGFLNRIRAHGYNLRHLLIVGNSPLSRSYLQRVRQHAELGLCVRGLLVDADEMVMRGEDIPVFSPLAEIRRVIRQQGIDLVVFALPLESHARLGSLLKAIEDLTVDIHIIPDVFQILPLSPGIEDFEGIPIVRVRESPQQGWPGFCKRLIDVVISAMALIVLAPLLLLIVVCIRLASGPPVFYSQKRMGLDGREFTIFKLRTMHPDAETNEGPVWAKANDPRRTRIGSLLRRYSLDELPQFLNVLKGDMSLVGPRPERPELIEVFRQRIPGYMLRYKVKAGLTGWAQVHGWRGDTSLEKRIEYDIQYMERWCITFDLKILWRTVWKGFISRAEEA